MRDNVLGLLVSFAIIAVIAIGINALLTVMVG